MFNVLKKRVALFQQPQREVAPQEVDLDGNTFIGFFSFNIIVRSSCHSCLSLCRHGNCWNWYEYAHGAAKTSCYRIYTRNPCPTWDLDDHKSWILVPPFEVPFGTKPIPHKWRRKQKPVYKNVPARLKRPSYSCWIQPKTRDRLWRDVCSGNLSWRWVILNFPVNRCNLKIWRRCDGVHTILLSWNSKVF